MNEMNEWNEMKWYEIKWNENQWKTIKNHWKSMKINENQ